MKSPAAQRMHAHVAKKLSQDLQHAQETLWGYLERGGWVTEAEAEAAFKAFLHVNSAVSIVRKLLGLLHMPEPPVGVVTGSLFPKGLEGEEGLEEGNPAEPPPKDDYEEDGAVGMRKKRHG